MKYKECHDRIKQHEFSGLSLWRGLPAHENDARLSRIVSHLSELCPDSDMSIFTAPGRTELAGNHTDHNNGMVLAAAINLDITAAVAKTQDNKVILHSRGYDAPFIVVLDDLKPHDDEIGTTRALIRGVAVALRNSGYATGGFIAVAESIIPAGSGLSSSAATEVLIACIFNHLYNSGKIDPVTIAICSQFAENNFYKKPCGLMDQIACASGGAVFIDFKDAVKPAVKKIAGVTGFTGYSLFVVLCGGSHADLTNEYASIPKEMKDAALFFKKDSLRSVSERDFLESIALLRKSLSDRALMRALHFFAENKRVAKTVDMLSARMKLEYFGLVKESGSSSWRLLQNCMLPGSPERQNIVLALAVTEAFLGDDGACRVHGGGFTGTIQVYVPEKKARDYVLLMEKLFGEGSVIKLSIREEGAVRIL
ncbi:MAG: galactokinase [Spirochaetaceae bacterium]|nr:MAG: galactokinase [Spirochaetaceae bacterium]